MNNTKITPEQEAAIREEIEAEATHWAQYKVPYCKTCRQTARQGMDGRSICPIAAENCKGLPL